MDHPKPPRRGTHGPKTGHKKNSESNRKGSDDQNDATEVKQPEQPEQSQVPTIKVEEPEQISNLPSLPSPTHLEPQPNIPTVNETIAIQPLGEPPPIPERKRSTYLPSGQVYVNEDKYRPKWESKYNGVLSMIGFAVGLTNILRFPNLCFHHGGGAFLVPYFFFHLVATVPVMYLEIIVGQYSQTGMISVWKLCPIFKGVGLCQMILPVLVAFYYNTIMAWALLYSVESVFTSRVPWVGCEHKWNTLKCRDIPLDYEKVDVKPDELRSGAEFFRYNYHHIFWNLNFFLYRGRVQRRWLSEYAGDINTTGQNGQNGTFGLGYDDKLGLGPPGWEMSIYLAAVYIVLLIFFRRGLRLSGKSIWVTVMTPYILMIVLIYRGISIPGAFDGVKDLFSVESKQLWDLKTWTAAAEHSLFTSGAGFGIHLAFASHNDFKHKMLKDCLITTLFDVLTSLLCAIIVFMALGSIAYSDNTKIDNFVAHGPDLLFEVCADAFGRLPGANFFSFIFYLMIMFLGFETTLAFFVCIKQSMYDIFGTCLEKKGIFVYGTTLLCYGVGLASVSRGGLHMFIFFETYTGGIPLLLCAFFFTISCSWFWGLHEICDAVETMTGKRPGIYFQLCWKFVCPVVISFMIILTLRAVTVAEYVEVQFNKTERKTTVFQDSFQKVGHVYAHLPDLCIPIGWIYYFCTSKGRTFKEKLLLGVSPDYEHDEIMATGKGKRATWAHYMYCVACPKLKLPRMSLRNSAKVEPEVDAPTDQEQNALDAGRRNLANLEAQADFLDEINERGKRGSYLTELERVLP